MNDPCPCFHDDELRVGISTCLLGQEVRYDGGHKRDVFITTQLGRYVSFVPVCPEVELGLGIPRESIRLEQDEDAAVHLVGTRSGQEVTEAMTAYAQQRVAGLRGLGLCGYIFKKDSPSCGLHRVRVYGPGGMPQRNGRGLYAHALTEAMPLLPVEEEGRLHDPRLRENFVEQVFAYRRLQRLFAAAWSNADLQHFHAAEKMLLMAHDPRGLQTLGQIVAEAHRLGPAATEEAYTREFMTAMARIATPRKHTNVLQHLAGYFKKRLDGHGREELHQVIADFHAGLVPLIVPVTLLRHYVRLYDEGYLARQTYLCPHPKELMLRNHV